MKLVDRLLGKRKINADTGCWIWTGGAGSHGYGHIYAGKHLRVHRAAYEVFVGPIPKGQIVLHSCDNPLCFNPKHLSVGTSKMNSQDMVAKGRNRNMTGVSNCNAKLSDHEVLAIRADTRTQVIIAEEYGIDQSLVSKIKTLKIWGHLKEVV